MQTGTLGIDLDVEIEGYYERAEPDVGIMSGGWIAEEIVGLWADVARFDLQAGRRVEKRVNLLAGVDLRSKDVQRLLGNIFDTIDVDRMSEALAEYAA